MGGNFFPLADSEPNSATICGTTLPANLYGCLLTGWKLANGSHDLGDYPKRILYRYLAIGLKLANDSHEPGDCSSILQEAYHWLEV
jgi:hypothetical protein